MHANPVRRSSPTRAAPAELTTLVVEVLKITSGQKIAFTFMRGERERYCLNATKADFMKGVKVGDRLLMKGAWSEAILDLFECSHVMRL